MEQTVKKDMYDLEDVRVQVIALLRQSGFDGIITQSTEAQTQIDNLLNRTGV